MFSSLQELAIINRSPRQSTVIAKETLELLSIDIAVRKEVLLIRSFGDINHHRYWSPFSKSLAIFVVSRFSTKRWFTQQKAANVNVNQYFPHKIPAIVPSSITVTSKWVRWRLNAPAHDYLLNRSIRRRSKKTSKLRVTRLCAGNSPVTGEFPAQMASNAENVSIWWRHHADVLYGCLYKWCAENDCSV